LVDAGGMGGGSLPRTAAIVPVAVPGGDAAIAPRPTPGAADSEETRAGRWWCVTGRSITDP
jgi:hypothetical protein